MMVAVELHKLTKRFGSKQVLNNLTFSVPKGSIFGLIGPNGAGKTTTLSILCGFIKPDGGEAKVLGTPLDRLYQISGRFGVLPQDAKFEGNRTVYDSLVFLGELSGMSQVEAIKETQRVLKVVGLSDAKNVKGKALSHGMAKRFGLAQSFMGSPEVVFLDEPTEGLDPRSGYSIREYIKALKGNSTVVVSSHNLTEIEDICDSAAIIDKGSLVVCQTIGELTDARTSAMITLGEVTGNFISELMGLKEVRSATLSSDGKKIYVVFRSDENYDRSLSNCLKIILSSGSTIVEVSRGRSLIEKFLEVT